MSPAAGLLDTTIVAAGGLEHGGVTNDNEGYGTTKDLWTHPAPLPPGGPSRSHVLTLREGGLQKRHDARESGVAELRQQPGPKLRRAELKPIAPTTIPTNVRL